MTASHNVSFKVDEPDDSDTRAGKCKSYVEMLKSREEGNTSLQIPARDAADGSTDPEKSQFLNHSRHMRHFSDGYKNILLREAVNRGHVRQFSDGYRFQPSKPAALPVEPPPSSVDDDTDWRQSSLEYARGDICSVIYAIITLLADMISDIYIAYVFWEAGKHQYFIATAVFIAVPAVLLTATGLRWYIIDIENPNLPKASMSQWCIRLFFLVLQIGPILRLVDNGINLKTIDDIYRQVVQI
jgi:hypothetical protein